MAKGKILAIDYGTSKIGLAVSDDARLLAFGRGIVDRSKGFEAMVHRLEDLWAKENIVEFVFGLPLDDKGEEGESAKRVRNFAVKLGLYFKDKPMNFVDESFSSFQAQRLQQEAGRHGNDDELAATIILQRYLDTL